MNKKIIAITVVTLFLFLGVTTGIGTKVNQKESFKSKSTFASREIFLGTGSIYGDGIEGNSICDAVTEKELTIKITGNTEVVDLYITYDIKCNGSFDEGSVYLFIQIDGVEIGNESYTHDGISTGEIRFTDVTLTNGDLLSYEIGVLYTNYNPFFLDGDADLGFAVIVKPRNIQQRLLQSPLLELMLRFPLFVRLFTFNQKY